MQCATPPSSTGTNRTKVISRIMVSVVPDAEDVLSGNHILLEYQMEGNEQRWVAVGATRTGRILNLVFAVRGEAMRPITGWAADKETADLYLEQWGLE